MSERYDQWKGQPAYIHGAQQNPLKSLEGISGISHPNSDIRRIANKVVREAHQMMLAVSVITKKDTAKFGPDDFRTADNALKKRPLLPGDLFFLMDEGGTHLYQGKRGGHFLQSIGGGDPSIAEGLEKHRRALGPLEDRHKMLIPHLVNAQAGSLIVETGAGTDIGRVRALNAHAQNVGATLLCHDVTPATSRIVGKELPTVPYITLPPGFLAGALQKSALPKILTLKDVITSMSFSDLRCLLETAAHTNAQKIVIAQSLGMSPHANVFPLECGPEGREFKAQSMMQFLTEEKRRAAMQDALSGNLPESCTAAKCVEDQLSSMLELLTFEVERIFLESYAKHLGFKHVESRRIHQEMYLEGDAMNSYFEGALPSLKPEFDSGEFNTHWIMPGMNLFENEAEVPAGTLRVRSTQYSMIIAKDDPNTVIPDELCAAQELVPSTEFLRPVQGRKVSTTIFRNWYEQTRECHRTNPERFTEILDQFTPMAREAILEFMFEGPLSKIPLIATVAKNFSGGTVALKQQCRSRLMGA